MRNNHGFTLIEIMISIFILSFALLAIANMQVTSISMNSSANLQTKGISLVYSKIEELMNLPYEHADLEDTTPIGTVKTYVSADTIPGYNLEWEVDSDTPSIGNKTINVNVTWEDQGKTKSFSLSFIKPSA